MVSDAATGTGVSPERWLTQPGWCGGRRLRGQRRFRSLVGTPNNQAAYLIRYNAAGTEIGSPTLLPQVQGAIDQMAMLPDGHFVVIWDEGTDPNISPARKGLYATQFNRDGTLYGVGSVLVDPGPFLTARAAISTPGDFAVAVEDGDKAPSGEVTFYRYFSSGNPEVTLHLNNGQPIDDTSASVWDAVDVAMDSQGNAIVVWGGGAGDPDGAQRINNYGELVGGIIDLNAQPNTRPVQGIRVAVDATGRFVVAWATGEAAEQQGEFPYDVSRGDSWRTARRSIPQEFVVNDSLAGDHWYPEVATGAGKIVITWQTASGTGAGPSLGQAYTWDNTLRSLGGNFAVPRSKGVQFNGASPLTPPEPTLRRAGPSTAGSNYTSGRSLLSSRASAQRTIPQTDTELGFALLNPPPETGSLSLIPATMPSGSVIGTFEALEPGDWSYSLVSGGGDTDNADFQIVNGMLETQVSFSDTQTHFLIRVRTTPAIGVSADQVFDFALAPAFVNDVVTDQSW